METAEVKKKGRVRHCYPRKELYHRFIHSPEYVYSKESSHFCSARFNYLILFDIGKHTDKETIDIRIDEQYHRVIAIIDREAKKIVINLKYDFHYYDLKRSIPDDYEIFKINEDAISSNILSNDEELVKACSKYLITNIIKNNLHTYFALAGKSRTLHCDYNYATDIRYLYYRDLIELNKKYHLSKYSWYNQSLGETSLYRNYNSIKVKFPTIRQFVRKEIYNKKEKELLDKISFYTRYCYGEEIPRADVDKYWNVVITKQEAIKYYRSKNIFLDEKDIEENHTWNQHIAKGITAKRLYIKREIESNIEQSEKNRQEALEKYKTLYPKEKLINIWRERNHFAYTDITYRKYVQHRNNKSEWITERLIVNPTNSFDNIQLKLEGNNVKTSNWATVTLQQSVELYTLFNIYRKKYGENLNQTFKDIKVGIYNLRFMKYCEKVTTNGEKLGRKEYLIQIGCHSLWLDDFLDFVKYYKLEQAFGITANN